ncbi:DUF3828 domain-containing protein [Conchiformibius kuhniae]|uniref:DUF3828 domain-containing protein n=1 Tax=Conchiformibius kuhniae TaxID=211502 RepID=A0A8T9MUB1_9NEIS|nr:DUF3828 domain-containing protein [Conchiformibius kuhniae]UOP04694.1 DUF3828 domain-containing protein [Conchiformibius kuhniae]
MNKYFLAIIVASLSWSAIADNTNHMQKIELVKSVYKPYFRSANNTDVFAMPNKFTQDFLSVLKEDQNNTPDDEVGCIGYDPIINGQDWNETLLKRSLKVKVLSGNKVEATFLQLGNEVTRVQYILQCVKNKCLIDDIFLQLPDETKFSSFKQTTRQCIAEN